MTQTNPVPPDRPHITERGTYVAGHPVEEFMVPLLARSIHGALNPLPEQAGLRVLDVGCGGQPFRYVFEDKGHSYTSLDASDPIGIVDYIAPIDGDLPPGLLDDGPYDFVLCTEVLEHVLDWERAFTNLARVTVPGGRLLLTMPFFYVLHEQPYDFWRATPHAIRAFAGQHGFTEIQIDELGTPWDVLGTVCGAVAEATRPRNGSLLARVASRSVGYALRVVLAVLRRNWLQHRVELNNPGMPIYLSNAALLERQSDA